MTFRDRGTLEREIERGQQFYEKHLRAELEQGYIGKYAAIDPESGQYFIADTGTDALLKAHEALPNKRFFAPDRLERGRQNTEVVMVRGYVNMADEAIVEVRLVGTDSPTEAVVDTGFSGALMLPRSTFGKGRGDFYRPPAHRPCR